MAQANLTTTISRFHNLSDEALAGDNFTVTATEQIAGRLDTKAVKDFLGDTYRRFEVAVVSTVIRIKAAKPVALAA